MIAARSAVTRALSAVAVLAATLIAFALCPALASATSTPLITLSSGVPASDLGGSPATVSMTAANPAGQPGGYNLSFRDVLPAGVSYVAGSSLVGGQDIEPQAIANAPAAGQTTLIWSNVSDLPVSNSVTLTYKVLPSTSTYPIGASYTEAQSAYVNTSPASVPKFDALGNPISASYTGTASASGTTTISGLQITTSDAAGAKLLRGVHTHQTVYTVTATNTSINPTTSPVVDVYLPAGLEFLGCGTTDNTTSAATNPGSTSEWPGSGPLSGHTSSPAGCVSPALVQTGTFTPGGLPTGVYTHVQYSLTTLTVNQSVTLRFVAGIPIRQNTNTWTGTRPSDASGLQAASLDNNSGPETFDGQALSTYSSVSGLSNGTTAVVANTTQVVTAKDETITKSVSSPTIGIGDVDTYTLAIATGEYRYVDNLQVADTTPDGECPVDSTCAPTGPSPSSPYTTIVQNANGSWSETFNQTTDAALAQLLPDSLTSITIPVVVQSHYEANGATTTPVLVGDSFTAPVTLTGSDYVRCGGATANANCPQGATKINHDMVDGTSITDTSSATQSSSQPTLGQSIDDGTSGVINCATDNYVTTTPVYAPGDQICFKVHIAFPGALYTGSPVITDVLPAGTTYNANSWTPTAANTVLPSTADGTTNPGVLSVTLGNGSVSPGQTVDAVFSVTVTNATAANGGTNLVKFATVNTAGQASSQRAAANYSFVQALLTTTEGIDRIDGLPSGGNPVNTDNLQVKGGDDVEVRVDVSNGGGLDATSTEVWEDLPAQLTCASVVQGSISDGGSCVAGSPNTVRWTGVTVATGQAHTFTYDYDVPTGSYANQTLPSHAGVRDYTSTDNLGTTFLNIPASNIDPNVTLNLGAPNTTAADDITNTFLGTPTVTVTHTTSVSETGNTASSQATIGERNDYTATITIPAGVSQGSTSTFTATIGSLQTYVPSSAAATLNATATPGGWTLTANGTTVVLAIPSGYSSLSASTVVVTWSATVNDVAANKRSATFSQGGPFSYNSGATGTVATATPTSAVTTIVEPNLAATLTSNAGTSPVRVLPGQAITYTAKVTNTSGTNVSSANHITPPVVTVPTGETPVNSSGIAVADGGTVAGGGAGTWSLGARTITFSVLASVQLLPGASDSFAYNVKVNSPEPSSTSLTTTLGPATVTSLFSAPTSPGTARTAVTAAALSPAVAGYTATATPYIALVSDASVTKTVSAPSATIGDPETYTVNVSIPAGVSLYDAMVRDIVPDGVSYDGLVSVTCTSGCGTPNDIPVSEMPDQSNANGTTTLGFWMGEVGPGSGTRTLTIVYNAHVLNAYHTSSKVLAGQTLSNSATVDDNQSQMLSTSAPSTIPATSAYSYLSPAAVATVTVVEPSVAVTTAVADTSGTTAPYAQPGDSLTYTLSVTNSGTSTAYDVPVSDTPNAHLVNVVAQTGASYLTQAWTAGTPTSTWYIPSINAGQTVTLTYTAQLAASALLHRAEVDGDSVTVGSTTCPSVNSCLWGASDAERVANPSFTYRAYPGAAAVSASVTVALPQLSVSNTTGGTGFPETANAEVNQSFGWRATVSNASPAATAKNVGLTYQLPANWTYTPGSAGSFGDPTITTTAGAELLTWTNIGNLTAGATAALPFSAKPTVAAEQTPGSGATHLNTSTENATGLDNSTAGASADGAYAAVSDTASADLLVPVLTVTNTPKTGTFTAGTNANWTVTVANTGAGTARNVQVSDTVPANDSFTSGAATAAPSSGFAQSSYSSAGPTTLVTWAITSIAPGSSVVITVPTSLAASLSRSSTLTNAAQAVSDEVTTPATDSGSVTVATSADLALTNSGTPAPATAGGDLEYTLNVTDNGPSDAQNVVLTDALPAQATFVGFDSNGSNCSQSSGTVTCSFATLAAGSSQQVLVHVKPTTNAPSSLTAAATVSSTTTDPTPGNNSASAVVAVGRASDLSLSMSDSSATPLQGTNVTYTLDAHNAGPSDAPSTMITDPVPVGMSFVSASTGCLNSAGTVTCSPGTIASGGDATATITLRANSAGTIANPASVTSSATDSNLVNNSATASVTVGPAVDLAITNSAAASASPGQTLDYTIVAQNNGPSDGTGVSFTDALPSGESFVSMTAVTGWSCTVPVIGTNGAVNCSRTSAFTSGSSASFDLRVVVGFGVADQAVANAVNISGNEADPIAGNNNATANTNVGPAADLSLTDTASPSAVNQGADVAFALDAHNAGPDTAHNLIITDVLPTGVSFASASTGCTNASGTVTCTVASLASGADAAVTIHTTAHDRGTLADAASVTATEPDPHQADNSTSASVTVGPAVDLAITNTTAASASPGQTLDYAITATNNGPSDGTGVTWLDVLPAGESFESLTSPNGWTCTAPTVGSNGTIGCSSTAAFTNGSSASFDLQVAVGFSLADQTATNAVSITGNEGDPDNTNNSATANTTVGPAADLSLTDTASPTAVNQGADVAFTLDAHNAGPDSAHNVTITDILPTGVSFTSASTGCSNASGTVTCTLGTVAGGDDATATIHTTAHDRGTLADTASVTATEPDPHQADNSASASLTVDPVVDLAITNSAAASVSPGQTVDYAITVSNNGSSDGTGVSFTDVLPSGESFVSMSTEPGWSCTVPAAGSNGTIDCSSTAAFTDGSSASFDLHVAIGFSLADQTAADQVSITGNESDPDQTNNSATASTTVGPAADVSLTQTATPATVPQGAPVTFALDAHNAGPDTAHDATITDTLPTGVSFASASAGCSNIAGTVTCMLGSLASGADQTVTIHATANDAGQPANAASVTANEPDVNLLNNSTSASVTIGLSADLTLTMATATPNVSVGSPASYTMQVHNAGPNTAHNVVITVRLPIGEAFVDASVSDGTGSCANAGDTVTCTIPLLAVDGSATVRLDGRIGPSLAGGTVISDASVTADEADYGPPSDLTASAPVDVAPTAAAVTSTTPTTATSPTGAPGPSGSPPLDRSHPVVTDYKRTTNQFTCSTGAWTNNPTRFTYSWSRDGTPIVGANGPTYAAKTGDEGLTLTCTVTASNASGSGPAAVSNGVKLSVPVAKGCPRATGRLNRHRLGPVRLGMTRAQARHAFVSSSDRGKRFEDFFCLTPIGVRVGYASDSLRKTLTRAEGTRVKGRVVLALTHNAYYALSGIRPGATLRRARRALGEGSVFHVGLNNWYLNRHGASTAVLKVRRGIVEEIGIANARLTENPREQRTFIESFWR